MFTRFLREAGHCRPYNSSPKINGRGRLIMYIIDTQRLTSYKS